MTKSNHALARDEIADPVLYRLYFGFMSKDILHKLGFDATAKNKEVLHDFHKRVLGYTTISGRSQDIVSLFLFETTVFWAERGLFVRTKDIQPIDIENRPLKEVWQYL